MKHVPARWLYIFHILLLASDVLLIGDFLFQYFTHSPKTSISYWGIEPSIAGLAGAHLLYGTTLYPWLRRKYLWYASLVSIVLFDIVIAAALQTSSPANPTYNIAKVIMVGAGAFLGSYLLITELSVIAILDIFLILGLYKQHTNTNTTIAILFAAACITGLASWLLCRRYYEKNDTSGNRFDALNQLLSSEQERSNIIIESITDGVIAINTEGTISLINAAAATMTEWSANEALSLNVASVVKLTNENGSAIPENDNPFKIALAQKKRLEFIGLLQGRKGKQRVVSVALSPLLLPETQELAGAVAVFRDISEARAEEHQRAEFISTASHEMRTPVAAIEGYLSLALNDKVSTIDSKAYSYLQKAHDATQRLGKLFQDLLTSARSEDGRLISHPVVIEMGDYLQKLTDELRFAATKKNLAVEFIVGTNESLASYSGQGGERVVKPLYYTLADPDRLREVVTNLFDNAVKYTEQGKISIGLTGDNSVVQFYIHDTGPGISATDIPHLFQKFYRIDSTVTRNIGGTGLGLFICRKIVELYKGRIWVESEEGKGSSFFVNLPRLNSQKADELREAANDVVSPTAITPVTRQT